MKKIVLLFVMLMALLLGGCAQEIRHGYGEYIDAGPWAVNLRDAARLASAELTDKYASYFTPDEFRLMLDDYYGSFAGVGIYMNKDEDGRVRVVSVMPGRPALAAGLEAGDIILTVDGESMVGLDTDAVALRLRGEEGTDVTVTLLREREIGDYRYTVTITRALIVNESVRGELLQGHNGIAYIYMYDFTENTPREFYELLLQMDEEQEMRGLILDLRSNGGGSFGAAIMIAGFFVPRGKPIVWEKKFGGEVCHRSMDGALQGIPVICLQNEYTASASETLIGALMDHGIATVIGCTSYGKGITQILDPLPTGGGIRYTQSRYYTPLKYDLHGKGLSPLISVETPDDITYDEYFDPYNEHNVHMQKALDALYKRL
ncbi:MAG: S41 family peptidase [Clostridiales bacterium]|nr:S41 family peptidase [Clostridiales bacterium]